MSNYKTLPEHRSMPRTETISLEMITREMISHAHQEITDSEHGPIADAIINRHLAVCPRCPHDDALFNLLLKTPRAHAMMLRAQQTIADTLTMSTPLARCSEQLFMAVVSWFHRHLDQIMPDVLRQALIQLYASPTRETLKVCIAAIALLPAVYQESCMLVEKARALLG
jgi:hypothetical protein